MGLGSVVNTGREAGWEPGPGDTFGMFGNCVTMPNVREEQDKGPEGRGRPRAWGVEQGRGVEHSAQCGVSLSSSE